jgi:hypothetical protein
MDDVMNELTAIVVIVIFFGDTHGDPVAPHLH